MKKLFVTALVVILSMVFFTSTALAAQVPSAESYRTTKSVTLKVVKDLNVNTTNGTHVKLHKGDAVRGYKFYSDKVYVKLSSGNYAYITSKNLRTTQGSKIPKLPKTVTLKTKFQLEGNVLQSGAKLKVQYYAFSDKGSLMAYCYEGFVPVKYLKK